MSRKKTNQTNYTKNELLIPSLALAGISFVLVGTLVTVLSVKQTPSSEVSADQGRNSLRLLTPDRDQESMESDLILLQEDNLDAELDVLQTIN